MKSKKLTGKLILNKKTISTLDGSKMSRVRGGTKTIDVVCESNASCPGCGTETCWTNCVSGCIICVP